MFLMCVSQDLQSVLVICLLSFQQFLITSDFAFVSIISFIHFSFFPLQHVIASFLFLCIFIYSLIFIYPFSLNFVLNSLHIFILIFFFSSSTFWLHIPYCPLCLNTLLYVRSLYYSLNISNLALQLSTSFLFLVVVTFIVILAVTKK